MTPTWFETATRFGDPAGAVRIGQFIAVLERFPTGHLVDLGSGHGTFARVAADLGWRVTAVDARADRFPDDPRVTWVTRDVRSFDGYEGVDVVACLGLWYHLTLADQRALVARCAPRPLVIDTHVGLPDPAAHVVHRDRLGPVRERDGYRGRLYHETGRTARATASWGNEYSFWPTPDTLERQLREGGYDLVDVMAPAPAPDRCFVVARTIDAAARDRLDTVVGRYIAVGDPQAAPLPAGRDPAEAFTRPRPGAARASRWRGRLRSLPRPRRLDSGKGSSS